MNKIYGSRYNPNLSIPDIVKKIRDFVKSESDLRECKWSITRDGGRRITISLMEAPYHLGVNGEQISYMDMADSKYDELNEQACYVIDKILDYAESYNCDNSCPEIDVFCMNFFLYCSIGSKKKDFRLNDGKSSTFKIHISKIKEWEQENGMDSSEILLHSSLQGQKKGDFFVFKKSQINAFCAIFGDLV
jgi:hypothetical protein